MMRVLPQLAPRRAASHALLQRLAVWQALAVDARHEPHAQTSE